MEVVFKISERYNKSDNDYHLNEMKGAHRMTLKQSILIGLVGACLMFAGDMTLYYSRDDYDSKDTINSITAIMKQVAVKRLYIGGIIGPIGAFIYCIGLYHMVLACREPHEAMGRIVYLINALGLILGGAYHIQCAYLGLLSRHESQGAFDEFFKFLKFQAIITFGIMAIGNVGLSAMILFGVTLFPRWLVLLTPAVLILATPLVGKLPKGPHMILRGGWLNIIYIIYYMSLFICQILE